MYFIIMTYNVPLYCTYLGRYKDDMVMGQVRSVAIQLNNLT